MSGLIPTIVTGDDVALSALLRKNGSTFIIDPGANVKASLISDDKKTILISPVVQVSSTPGADWANSLVVVLFSSTDTTFNAIGAALLEIQIDDSGKTTFFSKVLTAKGTID